MTSRNLLLVTFFSLLGLPAAAHAELLTKKLAYDVDAVKLESVLVYDAQSKAQRPGIVLVPNWLGINDANLKQAQEVAARGYVVLVADVYGVAARPKSMEEATKVSQALEADRSLMRRRMQRALAELQAQSGAPLDPKKLAAIGFCFGGTAALELARAGAKIAAVATFHGGLSSPTPADAKAITAKILALHGADDPFVKADEVQAFEEEMRAAKVDWQLVAFGNAVHSFTDVDANRPGQAQYNPTVTRRAYQMMDTFFAEAFAKP